MSEALSETPASEGLSRTPDSLKPYLWKKGVSPNPGGKPKGAKNALAGDFIKALQEDFSEHGKNAITKCRKESPAKYLAIIAQLVPKESTLNLRVGPLEHIPNEDIATALAILGDLDGAEEFAKLIEGEATEVER